MATLPSYIQQAIQNRRSLAVELSDDLYAHPELPDQEFRSSQKIVDLLREAGYEVEYPYLGYPTGFRAVLDNGESPSVGILTEYDALPGLGHACGHNVHGSMSVLAALALADLKDRFSGKVIVFGTPAEEEDGAKVGMAAQGAFDDLSAAIMFHSWSGGVSNADMDVLSLRCYIAQFTGAAAHAVAGPWKGHNALTAARKFLDLIDCVPGAPPALLLLHSPGGCRAGSPLSQLLLHSSCFPFFNLLSQRPNQHHSLAQLWTAADRFWGHLELALI